MVFDPPDTIFCRERCIEKAPPLYALKCKRDALDHMKITTVTSERPVGALKCRRNAFGHMKLTTGTSERPFEALTCKRDAFGHKT